MKTITAAVLFAAATSAHAAPPSYTYVGVDYSYEDYDVSDSSMQGRGSDVNIRNMHVESNNARLYGSYAVSDNIHLTGAYTKRDSEWETILDPYAVDASGDGDADSISLGFGLHGDVTEALTWNIDLSHTLEDAKATATTGIVVDGATIVTVGDVAEYDNKWGTVAIGLRYTLSDDIELDGGIKTYLNDWNPSEDVTYAYAGALYSFGAIGIKAGVSANDSDYTASVGLRYTF